MSEPTARAARPVRRRQPLHTASWRATPSAAALDSSAARAPRRRSRRSRASPPRSWSSDLTMPGLSGPRAARARARASSRAPTSCCSRRTPRSRARSRRCAWARADYLLKPIQPEELALVVERMLVRRAPGRGERCGCATRSRPSRPAACWLAASSPARSTRSRSTCCSHGRRRARGIALFQRSRAPLSDGIELRGFRDDEANARCAACSCSDKPIDVRARGRASSCSRAGRSIEALRRDRRSTPGQAALGAGARRGGEAGAAGRAPRGQRADASGCVERARLVAAHAARRAAQRRALPPREGARLHRRRHRGLQRALPAPGDRPRDPARRALRHAALGAVPRPRPLQAGERSPRPPGRLAGAAPALARCCSQCVRQVDTLARYGGDEFTILLVDTGPRRGAAQVAERIRRVGRRDAASRAAAARRSGSRSASGVADLSRRHGRDARGAARRRPTRRCTGPSRWAATASARPAISTPERGPGASARRVALNFALSLRRPPPDVRQLVRGADGERPRRAVAPPRPAGRSAPHARAPARSTPALVGQRGGARRLGAAAGATTAA